MHVSLSRLGTKPLNQRKVDVANELNKLSFNVQKDVYLSFLYKY
jgi:hypothetical protein